MESGFTIDDVRETLTRDVTRSLGRIERAAREILDERTLAVDGEPASLLHLVTIAEQSHAIYGTSRLVSAHSLADSASRMEALAHRGRDQLGRALGHLAAVRDIAAAMAGGSTDMLAMLSLELDAQPREAQTIAESWRLRVEDVLHGGSVALSGAESANDNLRVPGRESAVPPADAPPTGAEPAAPAAEAVDEGWEDYDDQGPPAGPGPAASAGPPGAYSFASSMVDGPIEEIDPDLAAVFAEEASSTLDMLDSALASLRTNLDDRTLLKSIERGFHTLKGAAATVGLAEVSARASDLQDRAELLVDEGRPVTNDEAIALVRHAAAQRSRSRRRRPLRRRPSRCRFRRRRRRRRRARSTRSPPSSSAMRGLRSTRPSTCSATCATPTPPRARSSRRTSPARCTGCGARRWSPASPTSPSSRPASRRSPR